MKIGRYVFEMGKIFFSSTVDGLNRELKQNSTLDRYHRVSHTTKNRIAGNDAATVR